MQSEGRRARTTHEAERCSGTHAASHMTRDNCRGGAGNGRSLVLSSRARARQMQLCAAQAIREACRRNVGFNIVRHQFGLGPATKGCSVRWLTRCGLLGCPPDLRTSERPAQRGSVSRQWLVFAANTCTHPEVSLAARAELQESGFSLSRRGMASLRAVTLTGWAANDTHARGTPS